jgi:hypothetical protein
MPALQAWRGGRKRAWGLLACWSGEYHAPLSRVSPRPRQAAPKVTLRRAVMRRVTPAGQVTVPAASSTVKSSRVNPPSTAGLSGLGLMTAVCLPPAARRAGLRCRRPSRRRPRPARPRLRAAPRQPRRRRFLLPRPWSVPRRQGAAGHHQPHHRAPVPCQQCVGLGSSADRGNHRHKHGVSPLDRRRPSQRPHDDRALAVPEHLAEDMT